MSEEFTVPEGATVIGADRQFVPVLIDRLRVDSLKGSERGYQRALDERRVQKIVRDYQEGRRKETVVSQRVGGPDEGGLFVVDGQHTLAALKRIHPPGTYLKVILVHWTQEEEQDRFSHQGQNQAGITANHRFPANLRYGYAWETEIWELVEEAGAHLNFDSSSVWPNITAVSSVERVAKAYGKPMLFRVIRFLARTWPDIPRVFDGRLISGLAIFLTMHPEIRDRDLREKIDIEKMLPKYLVKDGVNEAAVAQRLIDMWNVGRHQGNKLTFDREGFRQGAKRQLQEEREGKTWR